MKNERYADCCVLEQDRFGSGGSVFIWAGTAHGFGTNLPFIEENLNAQCYRDAILARHIIPLFQNNGNITLFQHDNATSHSARDTVNFLRVTNIAFINSLPNNKILDKSKLKGFADDKIILFQNLKFIL